MGIEMRIRKVDFTIRADSKAEALVSARDTLVAHQHVWASGGASTGERWYAWANGTDLPGVATLEDLLRVFRFEPQVNEAGDIVGLDFEGENMGDEACLFEALAPYVAPGSFIAGIYDGESIFRYDFRGGKMHYREQEIPNTIEEETAVLWNL